MTVSDQSRRLAVVAALAADEKLGHNIIALDVSDVMGITEVFVVASAESERQVSSIVEEIEDKLTEAGAEPIRREGNRENRWVLLDYGSLVVHIQREAEREFYGLDRLYRDCAAIEIEGIETPERPGDWTADDVDVRKVDSIDQIPLASAAPGDEDEED
ncbi:ribosome silencing factor [Corynebacterium alimapuense]|uniref:Ribosomal silencing factor RsfS n=1 Tax=Corynebacterium alimapuense TaxID=1576874 RepID=A0A3M8KAZ2_9CORY|nr:ribosome silencing factor [Corynebacterium alimapuense]RNE49628.1 ribosome silencing factor [Corynebacterium alimapuense]